MVDRQPDFRYVAYDITVPPATPSTAPMVTDVSSGDVALIAVECLIPPGPSGAVGWRMRLAGATIIPWQAGNLWIVADDKELVFDVGMEIDTGLIVQAYNQGVYPHTLRFRLKVSDAAVAPAVTAPTLFLPNSAF